MQTAANARTKMKALVVSRLLLGEINEWQAFEQERSAAEKIANRHLARIASAQIGRSYSDLSNETKAFITKNFANCNYDDLAKLCDAIKPGIGLTLRLDEFENSFFLLNQKIKSQFPFYAQVCISIYGLQFEFPEHHFMTDIQTGFSDLKEIRKQLEELGITEVNMKSKRDDIAPLIGREKFVSRSLVSAAFSLVEAFISGLFFTALHLKKLGNIRCDDALLQYARNKESAALKGRIDAIVKFASQGTVGGEVYPFKAFIEIGKHFRDAIHHTTPFGRKDLEAGQRLEALYSVKFDVAVVCCLLALETVLKICAWLYGEGGGGEIAETCKLLRKHIFAYSIEQGFPLFLKLSHANVV